METSLKRVGEVSDLRVPCPAFLHAKAISNRRTAMWTVRIWPSLRLTSAGRIVPQDRPVKATLMAMGIAMALTWRFLQLILAGPIARRRSSGVNLRSVEDIPSTATRQIQIAFV
jgi:hypothetical protein